jgi:predicted secreted protein
MSKDVIAVEVDEEFTISLQSIATAGYLWKIESLPEGVEHLGTENQKPSGEAKPGSPTTRVLRFRARKTGEYELVFALARPWEKKAIETKAVAVKVR